MTFLQRLQIMRRNKLVKTKAEENPISDFAYVLKIILAHRIRFKRQLRIVKFADLKYEPYNRFGKMRSTIVLK